MPERRLRPYLTEREEWDEAVILMQAYKDAYTQRIHTAGKAHRAGFHAYQIAHFMGISVRTAEEWVRIYQGKGKRARGTRTRGA